jgi:DNA-binding SARP family transcriptional activator
MAFLGARAHWVARDELAALLWPEHDERTAQQNLRVNLTRLRPLLAQWGVPEALVTERREGSAPGPKCSRSRRPRSWKASASAPFR